MMFKALEDNGAHDFGFPFFPGLFFPDEAYKHIFKFWEKREESGSYTFLGSERLHRDWALLASCALLR